MDRGWRRGWVGRKGVAKGGVVKGLCGKGGVHPPDTTVDGHQSGRYASYFNAFLFQMKGVLLSYLKLAV